MKKQVRLMNEFNKAFGDFEQENPNINIPEKYKKLRIKLMQGELDEVKLAIENNDLENLAQEIGDLLYTVIGTATTFGLGSRLESIFEEIHKSNMSKIWPDGKPHLSPEGKPIKPDTYKKPSFQKILDNDVVDERSFEEITTEVIKFKKDRHWLEQDPGDLAKSIMIEGAELLEHFQWDSTNLLYSDSKQIKEKDWQEIQNELADILIYCISFAYQAKINMVTAIEEKLKRQAVKFPLEEFKDGHNEKFYQEQKKKYREGRGR